MKIAIYSSSDTARATPAKTTTPRDADDKDVRSDVTYATFEVASFHGGGGYVAVADGDQEPFRDGQVLCRVEVEWLVD
jgi:hypothetical protein